MVTKVKRLISQRRPDCHHEHLLPAVLTGVGGHLPERGGPAGADAHRQGLAGRLLQVGQAGSQSLAQSVAGAGVAPVARLGEVVHEGPSRRLRHGSFPAARTQSRLLNMQKCHPMSVPAAAFNYTCSKINRSSCTMSRVVAAVRYGFQQNDSSLKVWDFLESIRRADSHCGLQK